MIPSALLAVALVALAGPAALVTGAHYTPSLLDGFSYDETISLTNGTGNYTGYTESTVINGSLEVTAVLPNGTDAAFYYNDNDWQNNQGQHEAWTAAGRFTFSPTSFLYVNGTDNQTGYVNPYVWFFMDNSLTIGSTFYLLNSPMRVVSTSANYALDTAAGGYVRTIFAEGNGSYERDDVYGTFTATYNWKAYFDPATGFIVGYVYSEQDTGGTGGAGFTWTDVLAVTHTSYPLTSGSAPSGSTSSGGLSLDPAVLIAIIVLVVVIVIVIVVAVAVARARRRRPLPRHSATGRMTYAAPPVGPPPPGISLTPSGQPAVQQIVIHETVKVNCRYCGSLIDATAEKCPFCGATRT